MHLARIFYLLIDPFRQNDIFSRPTDRVLHELIFSFIICIFFVLLIVWTGLYWTFKSQKEHKILFQMKTRKSTHEQTKTLSNVQSKTGRYYILKIFMIVALALVYPVQIIFSYLRGLRNFNQDLLNYCLYGLLGLIFLFILSFLFFTLRLKDILSKTYENPSYHTSNIIIKKVPHSNNKVSNSKQVNKEEINKFIKEISTNKMVQGVVKTIIDKNVKTNPNEDSDSEMDYQDEMAELDINIYNKSPDVSKDDIVILSHMADQEHSDMKGDDDRIQAKLTKNGTITSKKRENEYVLKETDISILNRVKVLLSIDFHFKLHNNSFTCSHNSIRLRYKRNRCFTKSWCISIVNKSRALLQYYVYRF